VGSSSGGLVGLSSGGASAVTGGPAEFIDVDGDGFDDRSSLSGGCAGCTNAGDAWTGALGLMLGLVLVRMARKTLR